jgi:cell division topological specificity factor
VSLFGFFFPRKPASASIAKERLQLVLAHERADRSSPDFLPRMQNELLGVVARYVAVERDMIRVSIDHKGNTSVLEINVEIPSKPEPVATAATA